MSKKVFCAFLIIGLLLIFTACDNVISDADNGQKDHNQHNNSVENSGQNDVEPAIDSDKEAESDKLSSLESDSTQQNENVPENMENTDSEAEEESAPAPESQPEPEAEPEQVIDTKPEHQPEQVIDTKTEPDKESDNSAVEGYTQAVSIPEAETEAESEILQNAPAPRLELLKPEASGALEQRNGIAVIDYSNTSEGYVMVQYTEPCDTRLKAQVKGPKTTYTYNILAQSWEVFPLSEGDGTYSVTVYRNVSGSKYASVISASFSVSLSDEFTAFLYPNQYVDYLSAPKTVDKAYELTKYKESPLDKVAAVYDFVVNELSYDKEKAALVQSGYLPVLDSVLEGKKGICFDYASLMTGMLRSQRIPCKLVVGYAGSSYHAWISVWTQSSGWIDAAIFFDGVSWHRMDPTFASSADRSDSIMQYIGDGKNYTEKYLY